MPSWCVMNVAICYETNTPDASITALMRPASTRVPRVRRLRSIALRHAVVELRAVGERGRVVFGPRHGLRPARFNATFLSRLIRPVSFARRLRPAALPLLTRSVLAVVLLHG